MYGHQPGSRQSRLITIGHETGGLQEFLIFVTGLISKPRSSSGVICFRKSFAAGRLSSLPFLCRESPSLVRKDQLDPFVVDIPGSQRFVFSGRFILADPFVYFLKSARWPYRSFTVITNGPNGPNPAYGLRIQYPVVQGFFSRKAKTWSLRIDRYPAPCSVSCNRAYCNAHSSAAGEHRFFPIARYGSRLSW